MAVLRSIGKDIAKAGKTMHGLGKAALAGAGGAALVAANLGRNVKDAAAKTLAPEHYKKQHAEVIEMKKSTFVGILVFLAAVAGALGALYVYVLRREKELDEYEKLLFSEDFTDDFPEDEALDIPDEDTEEESGE